MHTIAVNKKRGCEFAKEQRDIWKGLGRGKGRENIVIELQSQKKSFWQKLEK